MRERGTSLVEVAIAVAILSLLAMTFWSLSQGARVFGMRSAAAQYDAALAYAQALAANSGNGATLVFDRRTSADGSAEPGFVLTIYSGRPTSTAALARAPLAPIVSVADVRESSLGSAPFTIFLNGAGHASGMKGTVDAGTIVASDPGCPSGETAVTLEFRDARASDTRSISCDAPAAGTPVDVGTVAP